MSSPRRAGTTSGNISRSGFKEQRAGESSHRLDSSQRPATSWMGGRVSFDLIVAYTHRCWGSPLMEVLQALEDGPKITLCNKASEIELT